MLQKDEAMAGNIPAHLFALCRILLLALLALFAVTVSVAWQTVNVPVTELAK